MTMPWGLPDFDDHEEVHFVTDEKCGLKAIIAVHSTHLGPAAGGARFWYYAEDADALTDALRLSRGMSYKNAMAGLPLGGGKSVLLANEAKSKTPDLLHAFGKAVDHLGGRYVTAEDVGMSVTDMIEVRRQTEFVAGLPVEVTRNASRLRQGGRRDLRPLRDGRRRRHECRRHGRNLPFDELCRRSAE